MKTKMYGVLHDGEEIIFSEIEAESDDKPQIASLQALGYIGH